MIKLLPSCCKNNHPCVSHCPYCHGTKFWGHGSYTRTGFHKAGQNGAITTKIIPRMLCRNPRCARTFSRLPPKVLPYCRFLWDEAMGIVQALGSGVSSYKLARYEWKFSLKILLRFKSLFNRASLWLQQLCQETSATAHRDIQACVGTILHCYDWTSLRQMWYRRMYPARYSL